uniref:Uncharacterized protein n=1 Tax=Oryza brachyantha TaxID=4533 RepID=J3L6Y1_ORYBR
MSSSSQGSFSWRKRHASVFSTALNSLASSLVHRRCSCGASHSPASCIVSTTVSAVSRDPIASSHRRFSHGTRYACASTSNCTALFSSISSSSPLHINQKPIDKISDLIVYTYIYIYIYMNLLASI